MDALIEQHAGVRPLPTEAGIRCIVIHHIASSPIEEALDLA
jgi:hypothetical protein